MGLSYRWAGGTRLPRFCSCGVFGVTCRHTNKFISVLHSHTLQLTGWNRIKTGKEFVSTASEGWGYFLYILHVMLECAVIQDTFCMTCSCLLVTIQIPAKNIFHLYAQTCCRKLFKWGNQKRKTTFFQSNYQNASHFDCWFNKTNHFKTNLKRSFSGIFSSFNNKMNVCLLLFTWDHSGGDFCTNTPVL